MKWKWRNDRCSERNLCNCVKKPEWKKTLTCSQRQWLHSSVGGASHWYREVMGSNPVEVLFFFFQASLCNCIHCVHCDDHFFIFTSHSDTNSSSEIAQKFVHFKFSLHVNSYSSFFKPSMWSYLHLDWINLYQKTTLNCWLPLNLHVLKNYYNRDWRIGGSGIIVRGR